MSVERIADRSWIIDHYEDLIITEIIYHRDNKEELVKPVTDILCHIDDVEVTATVL